MATYIIRRCFSDDNKKDGMSTGGKIAVGAGLLAAGALLARTGGGSVGRKLATISNETKFKQSNLTGVTGKANGALNANSQRAADAGVKLNTSTAYANAKLANGTGINSITHNKPLSELEFEQAIAFSEHE